MNQQAISDRLTEEVERLLSENQRLAAERRADVGIWIRAENSYQAKIRALEARLQQFAECRA